MIDLINHCARKGVAYFAVNLQLNRCENGHMSVGNTDTCPVCGAEITDKYTRVVGFFTNVATWAKERREQDFPNRVWYAKNKLHNHMD